MTPILPRNGASGKLGAVLVTGKSEFGELLLDRHITWRSGTGRPISQRMLADAARCAESRGGYGDNVSRSILARAGLASVSD